MRSSGPLATAGGVRLSAPQIVIHAGTLVAFARDADHVTDRLWFRVLEAAPSADLATTVEQDGAGTWNGWYAHDLPQATTVPSGNVRRQASKPAPELRVAGMDLITVPPTVVSVKPAAADPCVLSDGQYVVVLRASDHGSLYVDRLQLRSSQERVQARTRTVYRLEQATEVRFQRSGLRDVPDGDTDSPSAVDLLGTPFAEPTYELPGVSAGAAFAATRVPGTGQAGTWHIAWVQDGAVQRYAFAQSSTDLVDLSRPSRRYAPLVPRLDGVALAPLPGRAPALGFYGELDATKTAADRTVDLPRAGRVALAVPVAGPTGLPFATAVVDCVLDTDGLTPDLSAADQTVTLVDGRLQGGTFTPDDSSPVFPTPAQAPSVSRLVDGLEVSGLLLGQVQPHTDPVLRAGEDGLLDLYVGGPPPDVIPPWGGLRPNVPAAVVAQFDPRVSRAVVALPWRYAEAAEQVAADVLLTARLSGPLPTGTTVSVSASRAGTPLQALADLCDVTVTYAAATGWGTETWTGVPREVGAFAAVLGGGSTDDTAAPAVVTGQTPFYDLGATRPQARLPLDRAGVADRPPVTPALTLVTARSSVPIEAVEVTADAPDRRTLRLTLRSDKGVEVRLVWAGLPALADAWPALLEGSAVGPTPGPGSTALLALATDAYQVDVPVLLLPATASADLSNLTITVVASLTGPAGTLDVTFVRAKDTVLALTAVPATVAGFAARLREADVVALGIAVDATGAAGAVLPTPGPVGPVSLGGWGALLDVVPPAGGASGLTVRDGTRPVARWGRTVLATPPAGQSSAAPRLFGLTVGVEAPQAGRPAFVVDHDSTGSEALTNRFVERERHRVRATAPGGPESAAPLAAVAGAAAGGGWVRRQPTLACAFAGTDAMSVPVPSPTSSRLAAGREWSFETWLRATGGDRRRIVTFASGLPPVTPDAPTGDYWVEVTGQKVLAFDRFTRSPAGGGTALRTGSVAHATFLPAGSFTWEVWVQPDGSPVVDRGLGALFQVGDDGAGRLPLKVGLTADRKVVALLHGGTKETTLTSRTALTAGAWAHVAVVGDQAADGTWSVQLLLDAVLAADATGVPLDSAGPTDYLTIGSNGPDDVTAVCRLAALRVWSVARTAADIYRTAFLALGGGEAGLLGSWPLSALLEGGPTGKYAPNTGTTTGVAWDAVLYAKVQPVTEPRDNYFQSVVASVGGLDPVEAQAGLASGDWNHLAVVYRAGGALDLNPPALYDVGSSDWAVVSPADALLTGPELAVDAWLRIPVGTNTPGTVASRWSADDEDGRSIELGIDAHGLLTARVVLDADAGRQVFEATASGSGLADGVLHHVAWTCKVVDPKVGQDTRCVIAFFVDGVRVGDDHVHEVTSSILQLHSTQTDLFLGRTAAASPDVEQAVESIGLLRGLLGRVRVWATVPLVDVLFDERYKSLPRRVAVTGLAAQWDFREGSGLAAADSVAAHEAVLTSSAPWRSLRATSSLSFVANGRPVAVLTPFVGDGADATPPQLTLGAPRVAQGAPAVGGLVGQLAETMVWDTARSAGSIGLQRFTPRAGDEPDLVAGWDYSAGGADITHGGNSASPALPGTRVGASDVPVGTEGPSFRNVYGGVVTDENESTPGRVAVGGTTLLTGAGTDHVRGVVIRHAILDPALVTVPDPFEVGEVDLVYVGQVQTKPTLVGYIEGAPPVPSENLTRPFFISPVAGPSYMGTSSVALVQDAAQTVTYTSSSRTVDEVVVNVALGLFAASARADVEVPGISMELYTIKNVAQLTGQGKVQIGGSSGDEVSGTWTRGQLDSIGVQGEWEQYQSDPTRYLVKDLGRRWQPANLGYALVESLTADMYAATFRSTGAAAGTMVVPNPAIPPDRNIVVFPMDDQYTKQGTLDGKVGFVSDPGTARGSYFRPAEAYALAARLERENAARRAYVQAFDARGKGRSGKAGLGDAPDRLPAQFPETPDDAFLPGVPQVGLVNRYVWHADMGLHAETESVAASSTSTFSGFLDFTAGGGVKAAGEFIWGLGFAYGFDISATHLVGVELGSSDSQSRSVSLDVQVAGERYLRAWSPTAPAETGVGVGAYLPGAAPGKVRAYRFLTMYLPPAVTSSRTFAGVVDPVWKERSNDPAARALRELDSTQPVWRVLHRVTYVERVPPVVSTSPALTVAGHAGPPVNPAGNAVVVGLVRARLTSPRPTLAEVGAAVAVVLDPAPAGGVYPPSVLEASVPWWRPFLERARAGQDAAATTALAQIVARTVQYVVDGYLVTDER